ncbi:MAG: AMP-binding protein, partial [Pseudomonadota bacterium]|nr:AMP-binding protein [Pseudomonadota bacterium]
MNPLTHSYYSGASDAQIIYETIGTYFDKIAHRHSANPALVVRHQGVNWTYGELQARVNRLATGLIHLGIKPGDRVGIWG